jgi:dCTP deaminase
MDNPTPGILTHPDIGELLAQGVVWATRPIQEVQRQPTTLDLRLGTAAWELPAGFLPRRQRVEDVARALATARLDLTEGAVLRQNHIYLVPLLESLRLPPDLSGRANPRSSIGRIDVFTRTLTDRNDRFDDIPPGYEGPLWLEVLPRSFDVTVATGTRLNQLRLVRGEHLLPDEELTRRVLEDDLLAGASPLAVDRGCLLLGLSLRPDRPGAPVGWRALAGAPPLDLRSGTPVDVTPWFEPVHPDGSGALILEPEAFTLLAGAERIRMPPDLAAEMLPWDIALGELRTNYAGFFDPGFGWGPQSTRGARAVLEVRGHDVPFRVEHGQPLYRLRYSRTTAPCDRLYGGSGSAYQDQGLALARFFRVP